MAAQRAQDAVLAFRGSAECPALEAHERYIGGITVCVRKRPVSGAERAEVGVTTSHGCERRDEHEFESVSACNPAVFHHTLTPAGDSVAHKRFVYHHVFADDGAAAAEAGGESAEVDERLYATVVRNLVPFARDAGGAATVIAYGQTGAGKTHTGVAVQDRVVRDLFRAPAGGAAATASERGGNADAQREAAEQAEPPAAEHGAPGGVSLAFFENQGDRLFDLQDARRELALREDGEGAIHVVGLCARAAGSEAELRELVRAANAQRASEPTRSNPHSSRSHAVCEFRFPGSGGSLRVVDLAGSERRKDAADHNAERIEEMKGINWSLGCLKECIRMQRQAELKPKARPAASQEGEAMGGGAPEAHVPYRRSKLTMLLKDCFVQHTANAKTVFLSHVSPMASSSAHTQNTLLYTKELLDLSEKAPAPAAGAIVLPDKWSKPRFVKWMSQVDDGRFAKLVESFQISGATFKNMPPGNQAGGLVPRVLAGGGTEEDAEALSDAFRSELAKMKRAQAVAAKKG